MSTLDFGFSVRLRDGMPDAHGDAHFYRGHEISRGPGATADGSFATWAWNGQRLIARTDRYGVNPLFYWHHGGRLGISPSPLVLLPAGRPCVARPGGAQRLSSSRILSRRRYAVRRCEGGPARLHFRVGEPAR